MFVVSFCQTQTSDEDNSSLFQVIQSTKGNPSVLYKGYTYIHEKSVVNKKIFRCKFHKRCKCPARLHTNEFDKDGKTPQLLAENGSHTHNLDGDMFGVEKVIKLFIKIILNFGKHLLHLLENNFFSCNFKFVALFIYSVTNRVSCE